VTRHARTPPDGNFHGVSPYPPPDDFHDTAAAPPPAATVADAATPCALLLDNLMAAVTDVTVTVTAVGSDRDDMLHGTRSEYRAERRAAFLTDARALLDSYNIIMYY